MLPLSLTLEDYAVIERFANLPRKLSTAGAPSDMKPETSDITYYAPWGNLAIFVSGNVYACGLVRLVKVDTGLSALQRPGPPGGWAWLSFTRWVPIMRGEVWWRSTS